MGSSDQLAPAPPHVGAKSIGTLATRRPGIKAGERRSKILLSFLLLLLHQHMWVRKASARLLHTGLESNQVSELIGMMCFVAAVFVAILHHHMWVRKASAC